jgi:hypothetical protein
MTFTSVLVGAIPGTTGTYKGIQLFIEILYLFSMWYQYLLDDIKRSQ